MNEDQYFFNSIVHSTIPVRIPVQHSGSYNASTIFCLTKAKVPPPPLVMLSHVPTDSRLKVYELYTFTFLSVKDTEVRYIYI